MKNSERKKILDKIKSPRDLKQLNSEEREKLASEIRVELLDVISRNGGHLAPNLGVVELTIALHTAFNMPEDKIIWDVSHQGYTHKLLTGRKEFFRTLRQDDGCCGFLTRDESEYDSFGAGHAGTAISAALGFAAARDARNGKEKIVAVVGDGSLNCGITLEGLNNVSETTRDFIVVLNDNKMSISKNVGAMAQYLNRIITGKGYNRFKIFMRELVRKIPVFGERMVRRIRRLEEATKSIFVHGVIFEELGFRYIGPVDGHNTEELIRIMEVVKGFDQPALVHVVTEKGHGYKFAEDSPERFHGLSCFDPDTGASINSKEPATFSSIFGETACELAENNDKIVAITAAMSSGTGLSRFAELFPKRFFDVGIAEEHAVVFAAGFATQGFRPIVAMYATFMQRALDYVLHDICLQNLPVILCLDRAGAVDDGPTHHGIYDLAFFRTLPNMVVMQPRNGDELRAMLHKASTMNCPVTIRYPRAACGTYTPDSPPEKIETGRAELLKKGAGIAIWALGSECATALAVSELLEKEGVSTTVVNTRFIKPFDFSLLEEQARSMPIATIEDSVISGGLAATVDQILADRTHKALMHFGWKDEIIPHGTVAGIREKFNLTPEKISSGILARIKTK